MAELPKDEPEAGPAFFMQRGNFLSKGENAMFGIDIDLIEYGLLAIIIVPVVFLIIAMVLYPLVKAVRSVWNSIAHHGQMLEDKGEEGGEHQVPV